ncbi:3-dehydroquinate synthase [Rhodohalobacter sp. SW132]|uniref:3-dehydroquinate synthase n=1 Tax=Rhodohalobacter sp. SW132 TaxID=2293433 RepID=UPI000E23351B|nr:3-dehydroquinate synthase [Rhodohalobacter sp. SW132]REL33334.1 3-dehydroquinate synthase [Rhodohalobacter sp. SW132]
MTDTIDISSSAGSYNFTVGRSIFEKHLTALKKKNQFSDCFIFADENVWKNHNNRIQTAFESAGLSFKKEIIPSGEKSKSIKQWERLTGVLLQSGVRRNTPLFAIGGGVTGDLSGFVASATMRGIPLIHVPTTLLAMVDSSIGGKTGVNHETGKNLVGAFYQPVEVIADTTFLDTLPDREWNNGLSEILKYGAIRDRSIFDRSEFFLERSSASNKKENSSLENLILDCAGIKADIVQEDEFESGKRAYLNFGHTFAHAMEKVADYGTLSHGEAVYLGMLAATNLSNSLGADLNDEILRKFRPLYSFDISPEMLPVDSMFKTMKLDKKNVDENFRFVLLKNWQQPVVETVNNEELIRKAWLTVFNELD